MRKPHLLRSFGIYGNHNQRRNNNRALSRYYKLRGEVREQSERRTEEIDVAYVVMMSCNAAIDS